MSSLLTVTDIGVYRGERRLFSGVNFALDAGDALVVEGSNGSGKTSLLRILAGLLEPDTGTVAWRGQDCRKDRQAFRGEFAWYGHRAGLKQDLTLIENLACERALRRQSPEPLNAVLARLDLTHLAALPLRNLSAGQQRRVALCRLLLSDAPLWLLDEPYTNLDRDGQALVDTLLVEHLSSGGACVVASHRALSIEPAPKRLVMP